jgi:membrane associated rhomboid family serine protease
LLQQTSYEKTKDASSIWDKINSSRILLVFFIIFSIVCSIVFNVLIIFPRITTSLIASRETPWGVFTSLFIHRNINDLFTNLLSLGSFFLIYTFSNFHLLYEERSKRAVFFLVSIMFSALLSNFIWIIIVDIGTIGASGLIYASEGVVTGFCLLNLWDIYDEMKTKNNKENRGNLIINLLIFIAICAWMVFYTNSFLSYSREVNVLIHGSSFIIGFILAIEWNNLRNLYWKN